MGTRPKLNIPYPLHGRVQEYADRQDLKIPEAYNELIKAMVDQVEDEQIQEIAAGRDEDPVDVAREVFDTGLETIGDEDTDSDE